MIKKFVIVYNIQKYENVMHVFNVALCAKCTYRSITSMYLFINQQLVTFD